MGDARQAPPALEVRQLSKAFGNTPALSKVDLAMRPGEVHGLLGLCELTAARFPADSTEPAGTFTLPS